jgi:hypothetical protein
MCADGGYSENGLPADCSGCEDMTTTTHRVNAILSTAPGVRKRPCVVCTVYTLCGDVCELCREDLHGLLAQLAAQQDTIIARMTQAEIDLALHMTCASPDEQARYAKLIEARNLAELQHDLGSNRALEDFERRYLATQALQTPLGAIVRADAKVYNNQADSELLATLQRKLSAVELAIEGMKESETRA